MKWFERDIIYSSQIRRDVAQEELKYRIGDGNEVRIFARQNPRRNRFPLLKRQKRERRNKERCCYIINLTKTTTESITGLIMAKISNIHWIEIYP